MMMQKGFLWSADEGGGGGSAAAEADKGGTPAATFEDFYEGLPDDQKALIDSGTEGLKNALQSERKSRSDLEKQVRDLAAKAEKGSDLEKQLQSLQTQLEESNQRAEFVEEAHKAGVKNVKLAYTVARQDELIDKKGRVNWEQMKADYPELFETKQRGSGDAGSGGEANTARDMNAAIRAAAGRS